MKNNRITLKRILAVMVSGIMVSSLCACGKSSKNETEVTTETSISESSEITSASTKEETAANKSEVLKNAPETYLDAILIQINPSFLMYVNEHGEVVKSEARNDDAKKMMDRVALDGRNVKDALTDIVNVSIDDGYLKPGGTVNITMMESFRTQDDADHQMEDLKNVAIGVGSERKTEINAVSKIADDVQFAQDQPDPGQQNDPADPDPNQDPLQDPNQNPDPNQDNDPYHYNETTNSDAPEPGDKNGGNNGNGGSGGEKKEGCPVCHGSGDCVRCNKTGYVECMNCHGSGKMDCHLCDEGYDKNPCACGNGKCYRCEGTGKFEDKTCDVCGGNGLCKECGGTAKRRCNNCGGTGKLTCNECNGTGKEECQGCHGSLKCEACGGSGLNPHK